MGIQASSRRLRRVVRALSNQEAANLPPAVAAQYRVRTRTLRRAIYAKLTGTPSVEAICHAFARERKVKEVKILESVEWATTIRSKWPTWRPGDEVPKEAS